MFGRSKPRTHTQQLKDELSESYDHLRLAAAHAAGGAAERLTPGYDRARVSAYRRWAETKSAFAPLYDQVREGAAHAREEHDVKRKKWPILVGLLAAGTAVGAAGAMVARRRRAAAQWDEYDPMPAMSDTSATEGRSSVAGATEKVASAADAVSTKAGKLAESLHGKAQATAEKSGPGKGGSSGTFAPFAEDSDDVEARAKNSHQ